jgi:sugar phosphate isomerase/epimerase
VNSHTHRISIEFISVFGLPPVQFVDLAADLGCQHIGMSLTPMPSNPHNYPLWSLREDAQLRRDMIVAMRHTGVSISLGEGFLIMPKVDIANVAADLDLMRELGAPAVNILSLEPDMNRGFDQCALFAQMAHARGLRATLEFVPSLPIGDLSSALAAVRHVGQPHFGVLIDAMHVFRSGSKVADVAAIEPGLIGYVQLCDVPLVSKSTSYADEARYERLPPGKGELPLQQLLGALPHDLIVGLELPMLAQAKAGLGPYERLSGAVAVTREMLERRDRLSAA